MKLFIKILLTVFCTSFVCLAFGQFNIYKSKWTLDEQELKGKVKSMETTTYSLHDDPWTKKIEELDTSAWLGSLYAFNEYGSCTEQASYLYKEKEGKVVTSRSLFIYDQKQNIIEQQEYEQDKNISTEKISYVYDDQNRIQNAIISREDLKKNIFTKIKKTYIYKEDKTVQEVTSNVMKNDSILFANYFDEKGNYSDYRYVSRGYRDYFGRIVMQKKDSNGLVIREEYKKNDTIWKTFYFKYDGKLNMTEKKEVNFYPNLNCTYYYEYDARNNKIIERSFDSKNKLLNFYKMQYDEHNNRIKITYMKNERKIDFEIFNNFIYDNHGNWISNHETSTNKYSPRSLKKRKISYYD